MNKSNVVVNQVVVKQKQLFQYWKASAVRWKVQLHFIVGFDYIMVEDFQSKIVNKKWNKFVNSE